MEKSENIQFINPRSGNFLIAQKGKLVDPSNNNYSIPIVNGIPRFVSKENNYAESFGWQWNHWINNRRSSETTGFDLKALIMGRTRFDEYNLSGKSILECGCGGGDDTEVLCSMPFSEIHSFDISSSVNRARTIIEDPRVTISQASIYEIPYRDESFDVVFCHRVLQHTPDPVKALQVICNKVKPGGILFAHSYKRSKLYMAEWRYKYLWITHKLPHKWIYYYVKLFGSLLHHLNKKLYKNKYTRYIAYRFIPFYHKGNSMDVRNMTKKQIIDLERLITFDALTPSHDHPMKPEDFFGTIERSGFKIEHKNDPPGSPMFCTAIKLSTLTTDKV